MSAIELAAAVFGIVGVYLGVRQNVWSWPVGIVNVGLYFFVFWRAKLYADMGLQVVYVVLSLYGWYEWLYGGPQRTTLPVSRTTRLHTVVLTLIGGAGAWLMGASLDRHTDAAVPYLDSVLTSMSLVAQWLMTRKLLESWLVWIAADVMYVGMFVYKALYITAGLYGLFCVLAVMGYRQWRASMITPRAAAQP